MCCCCAVGATTTLEPPPPHHSHRGWSIRCRVGVWSAPVYVWGKSLPDNTETACRVKRGCFGWDLTRSGVRGWVYGLCMSVKHSEWKRSRENMMEYTPIPRPAAWIAISRPMESKVHNYMVDGLMGLGGLSKGLRELLRDSTLLDKYLIIDHHIQSLSFSPHGVLKTCSRFLVMILLIKYANKYCIHTYFAWWNIWFGASAQHMHHSPGW